MPQPRAKQLQFTSVRTSTADRGKPSYRTSHGGQYTPLRSYYLLNTGFLHQGKQNCVTIRVIKPISIKLPSISKKKITGNVRPTASSTVPGDCYCLCADLPYVPGMCTTQYSFSHTDRCLLSSLPDTCRLQTDLLVTTTRMPAGFTASYIHICHLLGSIVAVVDITSSHRGNNSKLRVSRELCPLVNTTHKTTGCDRYMV